MKDCQERDIKTITSTIRFPELWIEYIKKEARKIAYKEDKDFSYQDLIRKIVENYLFNQDEFRIFIKE